MSERGEGVVEEDAFGPVDAEEEAAFERWTEGDPDRRQPSSGAYPGGRRATDPPAPEEAAHEPQPEPVPGPDDMEREVPCPGCGTLLVWTRAGGLKGRECAGCGRIFSGHERRRPAAVEEDVALSELLEEPPSPPEVIVYADDALGPELADAPVDPGPFVLPAPSRSFDVPTLARDLARSAQGWWLVISYALVAALLVLGLALWGAHNLEHDRRAHEVRMLNVETARLEGEATHNQLIEKQEAERLELERSRLEVERETAGVERRLAEALEAQLAPIPTVTTAPARR